MRGRLVVACAVVALAATSSHALAAPRRFCNIMLDAREDEGPLPLDEFVSVPRADLDLLSGDIVSDARRMTFVMRLRDLGETTGPVGGSYRAVLRFDAEKFLQIGWDLHADGASGHVWSYARTGNIVSTSEIATVPIVVDRTKSELRMTVPVSVFASQAKVRRGTRVEFWYANVYISPGMENPPDPAPFGHVVWQWDAWTDSGVKYEVGAKSCARLGA